MRVLHLMKTAVGGNWAMRQMRELVRLGVEVHAALPEEGPLSSLYRDCGIVLHRLQTDFPVRCPWLLPLRMAGLRRLVSEIRPNLIHSHFVGTTLTMRAALKGYTHLPRLFQVPGPLHLERTLFRISEIATADANDFWIGSCKDTCRRYLRSGVQPGRIFLSYYGVDLSRYARPAAPGYLRRSLGIDMQSPVVGMVAYMYAPKRYLGHARGIKGHEDLIDAIAIAQERLPAIKVIFVGGPWGRAAAYEKRIMQYARERIPGKAFFLGTRSDIIRLYADFDIAVHPSHSENLGGAVESLLLGVPTIATAVGGFPEVVVPGQTGCLVPARRPDRLAAAILEFLHDPERAGKLAANGRDRLLRVMDVRTTARQILEIYKRIAFKSHGTSPDYGDAPFRGSGVSIRPLTVACGFNEIER